MCDMGNPIYIISLPLSLYYPTHPYRLYCISFPSIYLFILPCQSFQLSLFLIIIFYYCIYTIPFLFLLFSPLHATFSLHHPFSLTPSLPFPVSLPTRNTTHDSHVQACFHPNQPFPRYSLPLFFYYYSLSVGRLRFLVIWFLYVLVCLIARLYVR